MVIFLVSQIEILRSKWSVDSPTAGLRRRLELGKGSVDSSLGGGPTSALTSRPHCSFLF